MKHWARQIVSIILLSGFVVATPVQAEILNAQLASNDLPGLIEAVQLELVDQVDDRCWTNGDDIRDQARGILLAADIAVRPVDHADTAFHPVLAISASGQRVEGGYCIVQTEIRVSFVDASRFAEANDDAGVLIINFSSINTMYRANIAIVADEHVNDELALWVQQVVTSFSGDVTAKRNLPSVTAVRQALGRGE